ncbi:MAG: AbrB/MazE/SpoVT family DNA-binding domain-containing protein [Verrucomicrobia bacterium]|nr:AbrB/MazE/SpoVT family DNA-binding domain-containing protein [Verrucomicrobiota bacterium]
MKANVTVDEFGRLVLPKPVREAIGVVGRTSVVVEVVDNAARITAPEPVRRAVARKRGRLVFAGPLPADWDSGEAVLRMRERRLRR